MLALSVLFSFSILDGKKKKDKEKRAVLYGKKKEELQQNTIRHAVTLKWLHTNIEVIHPITTQLWLWYDTAIVESSSLISHSLHTAIDIRWISDWSYSKMITLAFTVRVRTPLE